MLVDRSQKTCFGKKEIKTYAKYDGVQLLLKLEWTTTANVTVIIIIPIHILESSE